VLAFVALPLKYPREQLSARIIGMCGEIFHFSTLCSFPCQTKSTAFVSYEETEAALVQGAAWVEGLKSNITETQCEMNKGTEELSMLKGMLT